MLCLNQFKPSWLFYRKSLDMCTFCIRDVRLVFTIIMFCWNFWIWCKQSRPCIDAAFCGVWSVSTMFDNVPFMAYMGGYVTNCTIRQVPTMKTVTNLRFFFFFFFFFFSFFFFFFFFFLLPVWIIVSPLLSTTNPGAKIDRTASIRIMWHVIHCICSRGGKILTHLFRVDSSTSSLWKGQFPKEHYENTPIQIYRKFHLQKLNIFR